MKKLILLIVLVSSFSYAQNNCDTIGEIQDPHQKIEKCDNVFTYTYKDVNTGGYNSLSFQGAANYEFVKFEIQNLLNSMPKDTYEFFTPDGSLYMDFKKENGVKSFAFNHTNKAGVSGYSGFITEKQFQELFKWSF